MRPSTKRGSVGDAGLVSHLSNLSKSVEECREKAFRQADEMVDAYCREKAKEFQRFASEVDKFEKLTSKCTAIQIESALIGSGSIALSKQLLQDTKT